VASNEQLNKNQMHPYNPEELLKLIIGSVKLEKRFISVRLLHTSLWILIQESI
jgi:hypothetical protein